MHWDTLNIALKKKMTDFVFMLLIFFPKKKLPSPLVPDGGVAAPFFSVVHRA
jgi:hypothetical protein